MTDIDIAELRRVAGAATPGPWIAGDPQPFLPGAQVKLYGPQWKPIYLSRSTEKHVHPTPDAKHIATFDPPTVLALLDRLERAEKAIAGALAIDTHYMHPDARRILSSYETTNRENGSER